MIGALAGDIIGSVYEFYNIKTKEFPLFNEQSRFTDDSVMTIATMDSLLNGVPLSISYKKWYAKYPDVGYGNSFAEWAKSDTLKPYGSWGNGSAMRISPVGYFYESLDDVLIEAKKSAKVTHNHAEGIKGAQAVATSICLARNGAKKAEIKDFVENNFNYNLRESLDLIREWYRFDVSCQGSVPQAIRAFLESTDVEDAIRNAISIGGDSDTIACIAGAIAEAYYKDIPKWIKDEVFKRLPEEFISLINEFYSKLKL